MENFKQTIENKYQKQLNELTNEQIYFSLLDYTKSLMSEKPRNHCDKRVYYISAEFLIGKLLSNNLINLGIYDEVKQLLANNGHSISEIEAIEMEPSLGNGGLGRLAACFLDSAATLGLSVDGIGLNYHFGLFKQLFENNMQEEVPNPWISEDSWLTKQQESYTVEFKDFKLKSTLYDIDIVGYNNGVNKLHLFDVQGLDESIVGEGISFDQSNIQKNLTLFLYPDDSTREGHLLRIYQQYFMVSNGAQYIISDLKKQNIDLRDLAKHVVIQINDTHPTLVIPELIRLLMKEKIKFDEAVQIVSETCAYTNHTILAEALEKWPLEYLEEVVPKLAKIIKRLNRFIKAKYKDPKVQIIDKDKRVHMAHIDIHFSYSVNGVAALHTQILKENELKHFADIYPEKFNNKTNGITFRRWLLHTNPELTSYLDNLIGTSYKQEATDLEKLLAYQDDEKVLKALMDIKQTKKRDFKDYLLAVQNEEIDDNAIYDIQIKRLHEYKRQQMNALYIIHKYLAIKNGERPVRPINFIFGAKAAPAYTIAKDIIHLILCLKEVIAKDPIVSKYLKVTMVENYNVTWAEKIIPACDISEQISLASKEASGTGNMKFMLNGAITLGTSDGANVEIEELVGSENIYVFGEDSDTIIQHYEKADYVSKDYYADPIIKPLVDFIVSEEVLAVGNKTNLERLYNEILNKDWFMTLIDLDEYIKIKEQAYADYEQREVWTKKALINIAKAGYFSSDRTIAQYNEDIWHLTKGE